MARKSKIYRPLFSSHNSYEYFSEDDNDNVEGVARQPLDSHQGGDQHDDGHRRQEQRRVRRKDHTSPQAGTKLTSGIFAFLLQECKKKPFFASTKSIYVIVVAKKYAL